MTNNEINGLHFTWSRLENFSAAQWHEIIAARLAVFVVEQQCPYLDTDDLDAHAWHLQLRIDGQLAAYLRVVEPGLKQGHNGYSYKEPSIGRVLTAKPFRGQGLGLQLMQEGIAGCVRYFPEAGIRISAQSYLLAFYKSLGFQVIGEEYLEDDIPHFEMLRAT